MKDAELEYHIIAINKSGEGSPSNTVMVSRALFRKIPDK